MHGWQANLKRTCASPVSFRAMPENEIPPAMRVDFYSEGELYYQVQHEKKEHPYCNPVL